MFVILDIQVVNFMINLYFAKTCYLMKLSCNIDYKKFSLFMFGKSTLLTKILIKQVSGFHLEQIVLIETCFPQQFVTIPSRLKEQNNGLAACYNQVILVIMPVNVKYKEHLTITAEVL